MPKIQEISSLKLIKCIASLTENKIYIDEIFRCERDKLKNFNQEIYKRFIKPVYFPLLALICCFLITSSKEQSFYNFKTVKVFLYVLFTLVISEILMRYVETSLLLLLVFVFIPILIYFLINVFILSKVKYD